jgi:hypothetical protein
MGEIFAAYYGRNQGGHPLYSYTSREDRNKEM